MAENETSVQEPHVNMESGQIPASQLERGKDYQHCFRSGGLQLVGEKIEELNDIIRVLLVMSDSPEMDGNPARALYFLTCEMERRLKEIDNVISPRNPDSFVYLKEVRDE